MKENEGFSSNMDPKKVIMLSIELFVAACVGLTTTLTLIDFVGRRWER